MTDAMTASATLVLMGFLAFLLIPASAALLNHVLLLLLR